VENETEGRPYAERYCKRLGKTGHFERMELLSDHRETPKSAVFNCAACPVSVPKSEIRTLASPGCGGRLTGNMLTISNHLTEVAVLSSALRQSLAGRLSAVTASRASRRTIMRIEFPKIDARQSQRQQPPQSNLPAC